MGSIEVSAETSANQHPEPLRVAIAGAGIGGLSAAIALRQAGHIVELYESSRFAMEIGAAIHLPPNVNGLLRRFGTHPESWGANNAEKVTVYSSDGGIISTKDMKGLAFAYPYPWQLSHRIDLHQELKRLATSKDGAGVPAVIHTQSPVLSCDPIAPSITLKSGEVIKADIVLGADGVHSALRKFIIGGEEAHPHSSGGSAFRFLIPISLIKADERTKHLVNCPGELQLWEGKNRRLVIYPCRNNTELNFVCLHPETESMGSQEGWNNNASKEHLLKVYDEFCPAIKALLSMCEEGSIKLWRLLDRKALPTWIKGNAALLGDAAHPFLPHQGQGGAQAIEDGAALGALFPLGTTRAEIPERLELYMKCRYDRATMIQDFSRAAAFKHSDQDKVGGKSTDPLEFSRINFGHDAFDNAQSILLQHLAKRAQVPSIFGIFGPQPGPTQDSFGNPRHPTPANQTVMYLTFKTPLNYLRTFLPVEKDLKFKTPGGWATASFAITKFSGVDWLGGRSYSRLGLYIHNIDGLQDGTNGANTNTESPTSASTYLACAFESSTDAVLAHHDTESFPVFHASLEAHSSAATYELKASWEGGAPFFSMALTELAATGDADGLAAPFVAPSSKGMPCTHVLRAEKATAEFSSLPVGELEREFPTLWHVVERLRGVRIQEVLGAGVTMSAATYKALI